MTRQTVQVDQGAERLARRSFSGGGRRSLLRTWSNREAGGQHTRCRAAEHPTFCLVRHDVHYLVTVAPLMIVSGSTSVETLARTMISRSASAVGTWNLKFIPR